MIGKGWLLEIALRYGIPFYHLVDRAIIPINSLLHIQLQLFDDAVCQPISLPASVTFLNDEPYIPEDLTIPPWKILVMDARKEESIEGRSSILKRNTPEPTNAPPFCLP